MARIVPAKPKINNNDFLNSFLELESDLTDDFIIFQNFPIIGSCLIMKENKTPIVLVPAMKGNNIDFDEFAILSNVDLIDIDQVVNQLNQDLENYQIKNNFLLNFYTPNIKNIPEDIPATQIRPEINFLGLNASLSSMISSKIEGSENKKITSELIRSIINVLTPNSSGYEKGKITDAQNRWRQSKNNEPHEPLNDNIIKAQIPEENNKKIEIPNLIKEKPLKIKKDYEKAPIRVEYLEKMVENCIFNIIRNRPIFSSGVEVDPMFVAKRDNLLPAIIIAASEYWTPVVVKQKGKGGFDVRLRTDPQSLLGFSIQDVIPSAPMVLFMPITHLIRTKLSDGEFILDDIISVFSRWVIKHNLENTELEEIDLKIALKAIEGN
jgi:hypothetical protein